MALLNILTLAKMNQGLYIKSRGFTLIEAVVVIALIIIISGATIYFNIDGYRGYLFRSDRDTLISALHHARSEAIANICRGSSCVSGVPHGVKIESDRYIIFQGEDFSSADHSFDIEMDINPNTTFSTNGGDEVVFSRLSADVLTPIEITMTENSGRTSTISVSSEGQIKWD